MEKKFVLVDSEGVRISEALLTEDQANEKKRAIYESERKEVKVKQYLAE
jgi:hypothetical protein